MVVDQELEADAAGEPVQGVGLRLRAGPRAAVGLARGRGGGALVVVAPLVGPVAVEVDAVVAGQLPVAVVVAQVLAPQALTLGEGVVVAVGVGHRQEPQLGPGQQALDRPAGGVAVDDAAQEAGGHLGGDPLAGVLGRHVEHRRTLAVAGLVGTLGDLDRDDVLALDGLADRHGLGDPGVTTRELLDLGLDPTGAGVLLPHRVARGRLGARTLGDGPAVDLLQRHLDALVGQLGDVPPAEDRLHPDLGLLAGTPGAGHATDAQLVPVDPERDEVGQLRGQHLPDVHLETVALGPGLRGG